MLQIRTLFSSSKGNCILVSSNRTKILIDAGIAGTHISKAMEMIGEDICDVSAICITHEHTDHVKGAGVLSRKYNIPIYASPKTWQGLNCIGELCESNRKTYDYEMSIRDLDLTFFKIHHDAIEPVGICVSNGIRKVGICTDTGIITPNIVKCLKGADALVFEANHDITMLQKGSYPRNLKNRILSSKGHLSNIDSGEALINIVWDNTREIILAHLSEENNTPEIAYNTIKDILDEHGIGNDIKLSVAPPASCSNGIIIE